MGRVCRGVTVRGSGRLGDPGIVCRGRSLGLALLTAFCCVLPAGGAAAAQTEPEETWAAAAVLEAPEGRIEQVYANMPEITLYGAGFDREALEAGEGYLAQEKLTQTGVVSFAESGEGIGYYVLLDVSGSMPGAYFRGVKEGIADLQEQLRAQDKLVLCTFGEEVVLAADGSQTREQMDQILEGLQNRDQRTLLFEAIDRVAALAEQERDCSRKILAVISDGEDIAVGKKLAQEAQNTLREKGLPVYALCIRDTATANINTFGEFARTSGGRLVTFRPEEGQELLTQLAEELGKDLVVRYEAAANQVSNQEETFSLKLEDGSVFTKPVFNSRWIPDREPPRLTTGEAVGTGQLSVTFSEPVDGLETAANYHLTFAGEPVGITGVASDGAGKQNVRLSLEKPLENGTYVLECRGITDISMEKNPVSGTLSIEVSGIPEPEPAAVPAAASDYTGVLFLIFAAVVVLIILLVIMSRKKKKESGDAGAGGQMAPGSGGTGGQMVPGSGGTGGQMVPGSGGAGGQMMPGSGGAGSQVVLHDGGFRQHIAVDSRKLPLEVWISKNGTGVEKTVWQLGSSLIVGRSSICDVQVDDPEMSRQHFCLESDQSGVYLSDLGSTNGTSLNGIRIHEKRRLEPGAVIEAGSMKITVRW